MALLNEKIKNINISSFFKKVGDEKDLLYYGQISFFIGIIFLTSALPISLAFLLVSIFISFKQNINNFFSDNWNKTLIFASFLMIISCSLRLKIPSQYELSYLAKNSWMDILNWIPLFISFYGFQFYLKTAKQRILLCKALIISSFPFLYSCISQYWFRSFGPFSTFYELITWFQKPFENNESGLTGLFSNPNYAGYWLSTILPFSFYLLIINKNSKFKKYFFLLNFLLTLYLLFNTSSRNALMSISISILLTLTIKTIVFTFLFLLIVLIITKLLNPIFSITFSELVKIFLPTKLVDKLLLFKNFNLYSFHRFDIYINAINLISKNPILGWGASTFGVLYLIKSDISPATHTHNIILELAYNYGVFISLILTFFISNLLFKSWILLKKERDIQIALIDKLWVISAFSSVIFHMNDFPYYDGKISILFWLLLAGIKCILDEYKIAKS